MISDISFLRAENAKKPVDPPIPLITQYIHGHRSMPAGTPFPGPVDIYLSPHTLEIMDNMSPASIIQENYIMKSAQTCFTWTAENIVAYYMDVLPAEILYVTATEGAIEKWATKRLEPLIDSIGMRPKIYAQTGNTKTRRTGDKTYSKEYVGGALDGASAQSPVSLRSDTKRVVIVDEVDGAPEQLRTGEGNFLDVTYARTAAWSSRRKFLAFSTPTTFEKSLIFKRFKSGDQRYLMVPCPLCGKPQVLDIKNLKPDRKAGILENAYYLCEYCGDAFFNHHKTKFLPAGKWEPSAISGSKFRRSYHINTLYAPFGMMSWLELCQLHEDALGDPDGMRSFTNLYLGLPYEEQGYRPKLEIVIENRGGYRSGEIQNGVLYLSSGIDVQRGSDTDPLNPPRLELEVVGIGAGYRTWSVEYKRFDGPIDDPFSGAWEKLNDWALEGGMNYKRSDGTFFTPAIIFIDCGDGNYMDVVYRFCDRWINTFPSKGFQMLTKRKKERSDVDEAGPHNFKRYRAASTARSGGVIFYEMSTNFYKNNIYNNLKISRQPVEPQRPGFCDFPIDYPETYFKGLTAEDKMRDGSFDAKSRRNEPIDCRVMALCAADVYLDARVMEVRANIKATNPRISAVDLVKYNHRLVLEYMAQQTVRKKIV